MSRNKKLNLALIAGLLITLLVFVGGCATAPAEGKEATWFDQYGMIIFLVLIFAVFYFLMIRPQRKRQKEQQQLMEELKRGDKVITAGGIYGVIESVAEDSVVIKVESGATMRVAKGSVAVKREK
jgi:preprotein translocase subunit YajC